MKSIDQKCVDTIRFLSVDAVEKANSGHPGMPMGAAPMAYVLWDRHLRHNPKNPKWFDRDRFVLSAGHGSMLIYSLLHLYGYDLPIEEIENFRQWGSKTPGHPEYGLVPGVECTTGPLGQGFAMGVGMAIAETHLASVFGGAESIVDHNTYGIVSDGDLMEGIASEAASLAGTLKLGKLIYLYDDNHITIEGNTDLSFREDVEARFAAYGWHVQGVDDGNDLDAIDRAIGTAREDDRPSLIRVRTHIGYGSPKQDSEKAHGEALGADAVRASKEKLDWPLEPTFHVPDDVRAHCRAAGKRGVEHEAAWKKRVETARAGDGERIALFEKLIAGEHPEGWADAMPVFAPEDGPMATRSASGKVLNAFARVLPTMIGGSADLAGSNKSEIAGAKDFGIDGDDGRNMRFGVREHAMGAIVNGMALHGGVVPYGATFLVFADYMRASIRLASIMQAHSMFIFTHDSIGLGEDGPTHQPIEQMMSLRIIPGLTDLRPADANETAAAWKLALERPGPSVFALTRQNLPILSVDDIGDGVARGAYVLRDTEPPDVIIVASGSEVHLANEAATLLGERGKKVRVVSMPSWQIFGEQSAEYRASVLPAGVPKLAVEAGSPWGWRTWVGDTGDVIGLDRFGESAPGDVVMDKLGFNVANVVDRAEALIKKHAAV